LHIAQLLDENPKTLVVERFQEGAVPVEKLL